MRYLITGATGNIGARVVERLLARGERPRVFVRDLEKARARYGARVDVAVGDLGDVTSLARALSGVDALLLVSSGPGLEGYDAVAAKVARVSGVKLLVKLSSLDADQQIGTGLWHARGEAAIVATGIDFVFVRPTGFMDNALFWAQAIRADGVVRSPTGEGRIAFIHSDDIADVATKALTTREYVGQALPITGPEALSYGQMTNKIAAALDRPLRYERITDEEAAAFQVRLGEPPAMVDAHLSIYRAIREGRLAIVTREVDRVLQRPAIGFDRWIEQHRDAFT